MPEDYIPPTFEGEAFHCPHCGAYAHQKWQDLRWSKRGTGNTGWGQPYDGRLNKCQKCGEYGIWVNGQQVFPQDSLAPLPNEDMPDEVKKEYNEARRVVAESPKAAAAILRLAMEKLAEDLTGTKDQTLYQNIGDLLDEGRIDGRIQQALDSVRVIGNDYVHAGEIYHNDDAETALRLFKLVNAIVEMTISRDNLIKETYTEIPENKLEGIRQRDED